MQHVNIGGRWHHEIVAPEHCLHLVIATRGSRKAQHRMLILRAGMKPNRMRRNGEVPGVRGDRVCRVVGEEGGLV